MATNDNMPPPDNGSVGPLADSPLSDNTDALPGVIPAAASTTGGSGLTQPMPPAAFNVAPDVPEDDGMSHDDIGDCIADCCCCINDASQYVQQQIVNALLQINASIQAASQSISASLASAVATASAAVVPAQYHVDDEIMAQLAGIHYILDTVQAQLQQQEQHQSQEQQQTQSVEFSVPPTTVEDSGYVPIPALGSEASGGGGGSGVGSVVQPGSTEQPGSVNGVSGGGGGSSAGGGGGGGGGSGGTGGTSGTVVNVGGGKGGLQAGGKDGTGASQAQSASGTNVSIGGNTSSVAAGNGGTAFPVLQQNGGKGGGVSGKTQAFPVDLSDPIAFFFAPDDNSWRANAINWYADELAQLGNYSTFKEYVQATLGRYGKPGKRSDTEPQG